MRIDSEKLLAARKAARLTQDQLAERAGVSRKTIWNLEHGRSQRPFSQVIIALARALDIPMAELTVDGELTASNALAAALARINELEAQALVVRSQTAVLP